MADNAVKEDDKSGVVYASLRRTSKQIRTQRGDAIAEDLEMAYMRKAEDITRDIKRLKRQQDNAFDFSPDNAQSLIVGKDFDADAVLEEDIKLAKEVQLSEIQYNRVVRRINILFGQDMEILKIEY